MHARSGARGDARDRTNEFFATADTFRQQLQRQTRMSGSRPRPQPASNAGATSALTASNFAKAASSISEGIQSTTTKLGNLTRLAKGQSLFNDPAQEIQELTNVIKSDLKSLSKEIDVLQNYVLSNRTGVIQMDSHSDTVVSALKTKVANQTKSFADVLKLRSRNMKRQNDRRMQFTSGGSYGMRQRLVVQQDTVPTGDVDNANQAALQQEQQQLMRPQANSYLSSRAEAVQNIESTISELGEMYQKLASIVSMQNEMTIRIDQNMDTTVENTQAGYVELLKFYDTIKSNRWLIIKIFLTLIIFAMIFAAVS